MAESIIVEGKTTNEAIENGLKQMKVSKNMVDIKVLESEDKRSFFSILTPRVVKVQLTLKDDAQVKKSEVKKDNPSDEEIETAKNNIELFLNNFMKNLPVSNINKKIDIKDFNIYVDITGENINFLIGYRGEVLNSLQVILNSVANKNSKNRIRVYLNVQGYKEKREKALEDLAEKIAKTVVKTKKSITLEPMTSYERKIIHSKLQNHDKVKTFSKGEEPYRKVIITLK